MSEVLSYRFHFQDDSVLSRLNCLTKTKSILWSEKSRKPLTHESLKKKRNTHIVQAKSIVLRVRILLNMAAMFSFGK